MDRDKRTLAELKAMLEAMPREDVQRFCEGTMNALVVAEHVFRERFPREFEAWEAGEFFNGTSPLEGLR